jgi:beta-lactamase superfamily II metal-dependent hydrolase
MTQKTHRISFHFFDIGGGDAIFIRFLGTDSQWHNILVDGGYGKEYKNSFAPLIKEILSSGEQIENWVISHIDRDHIGAVKGFVVDKKIESKQDAVKNFLFNHSPEMIKESNGKISVGDGILLRDFLTANNLLTTVPINTETLPIECFGFKMTILSPTPEKEAAATELWKVEESNGKIGRKENQSDHKKIIEELIGNEFKPDTDPVNGSSIAVLVEFDKVKVLLLADSHPSDIIDSLDALGYNKDRPLPVKFMQLSHHGSKANTCPKLLEIVQTNCYVITGNGIHNRHPDKETIVRIITNERRNSEIIKIHFACDTQELRNIFEVDDDAFERYTFGCDYSQIGPDSLELSYLPLTDKI